MNDSTEYLTQEKYNEFKSELDYLKHTKRKEVAEALEYAKSLGDLSENAEYHEARDNQANVEDRIARLELILKDASIVSSTSKHNTDVVAIGSVVTVQKEGSKPAIFTIVGSEEADSSLGKISIKSPIGSALMGRKKKDSFNVNTPLGVVKYVVVEIK